MKITSRLLPVVCILLLTGPWAFGQEILNLRAELKVDIIEITFDLKGEEGQTYNLTLYGSHNVFNQPLLLVSGDIGKEISPGIEKKITWRVHEEFGDTKGEVTMELRGIPTPPFLQVVSPQGGDRVRRGKTMEVQWTSNDGGQVEIALQMDGKVVATAGSVPNNGSYSWPLDSKLAKDKGYRLVFTSTANGSKTVRSSDFAVQSKMALGLKVLPLLVAGGVAVILMSGQPEPESPATQGISLPIGPGG